MGVMEETRGEWARTRTKFGRVCVYMLYGTSCTPAACMHVSCTTCVARSVRMWCGPAVVVPACMQCPNLRVRGPTCRPGD